MMEKKTTSKPNLLELLKKPEALSLRKLRHISHVDMADFLSHPENVSYHSSLFEILLKYKLAVPTLSEMQADSLKLFLQNQKEETLVSLFSEGAMDDLIYLLEMTEKADKILEKLPFQQKKQLEKFMAYPKDSSGRIMQDDYFSLPLNATVGEGIEKLREYSREKFVHYIYVLDDLKTLKGVLSIRQLAIADPKISIQHIMNENMITSSPHKPATETAQLVSRHNFIALPVVDQKKRLLGLITVDDVLDIIEESAEAQIYAMAGLQEEDRVYTKSSKTIKNRLPWLALNLVFAVFASFIISLFEESMSRLIILATLKNIVAGIGGNTAIQTLTVTTRGLDTGDFQLTSFAKAFRKETISGLVMGAVLGLLVAVLVFLWKGSLLVACILALAMLLNSLMAVWSGLLIPIWLKKNKKDPAVGAGVLVTVITDIFGFFIFLGMASLALQFFGETL